MIGFSKNCWKRFLKNFISIFFPSLYHAIDFTGLRFLQQELFTDVTSGDKHRVDLLAEVGLQGENGLLLIHIENQAQFQPEFAERMFIYFSRLYQKFRRKILPFAIFSYNTPHDEPDHFQIGFPFFTVNRFQFHTLELKKHNWKEFLQSNNPVAAALMSKMGYLREEKVQVKKEFLRVLVRLQLDPARSKLLTGFFETYLKLNKREEKLLEVELQKLPVEEASKIMEMTTSWHEKGRTEGLTEGLTEGRLEGKREIARNMLLTGMNLAQIVTLTGLPEAEVIKLQQELAIKEH